MDSFQEVYTSDSDEEINSSKLSGDLTIEDSSASGSDEEIVRKPKKLTQKRAVIISDSEDEEEEQFERRVLSPRTRMSITGVRPADLSGDSSEFDDSSEDEDTDKSHIDDVDDGSFKENPFLRDVEEKNSFHDGSHSHSEKDLTSDDSETETDTPTKAINQSLVPNPMSRPSIVQYSTIFGNSLEDKFSSTMMIQEKSNEPQAIANDNVPSTSRSEQVENHDSDGSDTESELTKETISPTLNPDNKSSVDNSRESQNGSNDSDIVELKKSIDIVDISSDDSEEPTFIDSKPLKHETTKSITNTVQPKISAVLPRVTLSNKGSNNIKRVSKEFYDKEVKKLDELRFDLANAESLLEKLGPSLFDGGKQLSMRVASLQNNVKKKAEEVVNLQVEDDDAVVVVEAKKKPFFNQDLPDWDELSAQVNSIKPVHTGTVGLNTFNKQKVLTMERLKDIHGSLETRPGDDVLADDPKGLKISLMDHQKHALAWMNWREQQRPRGGILADDMGLGKTLSMISLVLDVKNREEDNEESDDDSEEEHNGWSTKNRKDYHNGGTLIVCPASLLRQWESEVNNRVHRHKLSVSVHHGQSRDTKPRHLATYDIVVTTYQIVTRESKNKGALFSIAWKRVILDEAHVIRNHKSQSSIAVCELRSKCRWALTGTPIQNKELDVYALLKFIKCSPFDDLGHWKKWIDNKSAGGQQRLNTLMKSLMLRRTKAQLQQLGSLACLPEREPCKNIEVILEKDEMNVYQKIMTYSKTLFAQFLYQRAEKNNDMYFLDQGSRPTYKQTKDPNGAYHKMHQKFSKLHGGERDIKSHEILVLLLRLRQICCHPGLIDAMLEDEDETVPTDSCCSEPDIDLLDQLNKLAITDDPVSNETDNVDLENKGISRASARVLQRSNPVFNLARPSSKMKKVLQIVDDEILKSSDKAIIVSQWTSTLNILQSHLEAKNVATLSLNGSILVKNRQAIVDDFNNPRSSARILLLSLTAGGVGLNLVGANHLLLIDIHWNPQLESQAQDRIYRVGQKKTVHIYKFICKDTVEERIKALQDHKLEIANGVLTGSKASGGSKLTIDDLKGLFGL
ncbi:transcription termination factor 2 [Episyrphus balteatus]|uniref:transcription termination factor 2 n=1 Tax=Episyrphus balteatus TaxID=286459 RepID=UPI002485B296|nr:transcription termination factor 2 [Episyrphus balteatus]